MRKINTTKGFTLIELLVVIAIIGILSSIILAALNTARGKGADAAIESGMDQLRAQAEIFSDGNNNSYGGDSTVYTGIANCTGSTLGFLATGQQGATILNNINSNTNGAAGLSCYVSPNAWMVVAPLKGNAPNRWCVDSNGISTSTNSSEVANTTGSCSS